MSRPTGRGWFDYTPDLRKSFDDRVEINEGVLYRKSNILQVWWTCDTLGRQFIPAEKGRETWTMPTESDAIEAFVNRWANDEF